MQKVKQISGATRMEAIAVLGMGHVGVPTALTLAELGWRVIGADTDPTKIHSLQQGVCPFYEPGLDELLQKHVQNPLFSLTSDIDTAIRSSNVLFLCVGTPQHENGEPDLSAIETLARAVARNLNGYKLIVEKSTVPAVTGQWIRRTVERYARSARTNGNKAEPLDFDVASNPEFLREGTAVHDCFNPDRIVCGISSDRARDLLKTIYAPLNRPILFTDPNTAEIIKHAANAFLATKISFINMVADICDAVGADVKMVASGIGMDARINPHFLNAGIGFGGYCLPKDLRAFSYLAAEHRVNAELLRQVDIINAARVPQFIQKLRRVLWILRGKKIAVLGLSFKASTDDTRESPSLQVVRSLVREGATVAAYDPSANENARAELASLGDAVRFGSSPYEVAAGAHALLILTEWDEFKHLDLERIAAQMAVPVIADGRNLLDPETVRRAGFEYVCMGRLAAATQSFDVESSPTKNKSVPQAEAAALLDAS